MILHVTEEKWQQYIAAGKTIGEIIYENDREKLSALDVNKIKKNRVTATQFASEKAIASTPRSPRFNTTVPQNGTGVNSCDMQNGGENSQFSFGGVNGTDINVPYEGELTTPPPSNDGTSPDKGRLGDAANRQALQNLDEAADRSAVMRI